MPDRWYVARINVIPIPTKFLEQGVHPYAYAIKNLERQEFPVYCPLIHERRVWRDRRIDIPVPIFRSYIFVFFNLAEMRWRKINYTRGVVRLLPTHSEEPAPLPTGFVEGLKEAEASRTAAAIAEVVQTFARNALVRILAGALAGQTGRVLSSSRQTTRVEIEAFHRHIVTTLDTDQLEGVLPS